MIAVNQVLTPKVTQGAVTDEAVTDPEIPFSNTLDDFHLDFLISLAQGFRGNVLDRYQRHYLTP